VSRADGEGARAVGGRVSPGGRGCARNRSRDPDAAGRHKAGPRGGGLTLGSAIARPVWGRVYPGRRGAAATAVGNRTPLAGIKPAPQGEGTRPSRQYARPVWGRVYPGRRGGGHNRNPEKDAAIRHETSTTDGSATPGE